MSRRTQGKMSSKSIKTRLEILHRLAVNAWKRAASERESSDGLELNFCRSEKAARASEKTSRRRMSYYLSAIHADLKALSRLNGNVKLFTPITTEPVYSNSTDRQLLLPPSTSGPSTSYAPIRTPEPESSGGETSTEERSAKFFIGSVPKNFSSSSSMEDVMLKPILAPMKRSSSSGGSSSDLNELDNPEFSRSLDLELDQQHTRLGSFLRQHSTLLIEMLADWDRYDVPNWKALILSEISSEMARAEFLLKEQVDMLSEYMTTYYPSIALTASRVNSAQCALVRLISDKFIVAVRYIRRMFCLL